MNDKEKLGGKLSDEDKQAIEEAVEESISWLDANKDATVEEFKEQKSSIESKVQPIISKLYADAGQTPTEETATNDNDEKDEL